MARLGIGTHGLNARVTVPMAHDCDCAAAQIPNPLVAGTIATKLQTASRKPVCQLDAQPWRKQQQRYRQQVRTILERQFD